MWLVLRLAVWLVLSLAVVATEAEYYKRTKYQELDSVYHFVPLAIKT